MVLYGGGRVRNRFFSRGGGNLICRSSQGGGAGGRGGCNIIIYYFFARPGGGGKYCLSARWAEEEGGKTIMIDVFFRAGGEHYLICLEGVQARGGGAGDIIIY